MKNIDWITEWDKEKLYEKVFDALDFVFLCIRLSWIIIVVICINLYLMFLFSQTLEFIYPCLGLIILALGIKVHTSRNLGIG